MKFFNFFVFFCGFAVFGQRQIDNEIQRRAVDAAPDNKLLKLISSVFGYIFNIERLTGGLKKDLKVEPNYRIEFESLPSSWRHFYFRVMNILGHVSPCRLAQYVHHTKIKVSPTGGQTFELYTVS